MGGRWRRLLRDGVPVWVRKASAAGDETPAGGVGRSVGLFATGSMVIEPGLLAFSLTARAAIVRP